MLFKLLLVLHLLGSSIWVGGHLVMAVRVLPKALKQRDPAIIAGFEAVFEKIGIPALLLQIATGIGLAYQFTINLFDVFDFEAGPHAMIALKLILLLATLIIAAHARIRLIGKLTETNLSFLAWHIRMITVLAVAMLVFGAGVRLGGWW
ncbi:MAG: copper resistance protein CopD [Bacteroidota bacterium]|nr:copper resistance protein CopD [Bacteroidota bacterium]